MTKSRTRILFEEEDNGPEWIVVYYLGSNDIDDDFEDNSTTEIVLNAPNFDVAVRYAQQYLRKMQSDEQTASDWATAEILSVELH